MKDLHQLRATYQGERAAEFSGSYARALMQRAGAVTYGEARLPDRVRSALAAVTASDINASVLSLSSAFLNSLQAFGAFDRIRQGAARVPVDGASAIRYVTSTLSGDIVGEAQGKPLHRVDIDAGSITKSKATCMVVLTKEALRDGGSDVEALLSRELRRGVVASTDGPFLLAMSQGLTPITSAGATAANVLQDFEALADAVTPDSNSSLFMVVSADQARALAFKETTTGAPAFPDMRVDGGTIAGVDVIPSDSLPLTGSPGVPTPLLLDASQLVMAAGEVGLRSAEHASIEMDTAPSQSGATGSPVAPVGSETVSLWQVNSVALLAERRFGFARIRSTAVAQLDGVTW